NGLVATVPGAFGWNDVGDFHTLGDILPRDEANNVIVEPADHAEKPEVLLVDSAGVVVVPHSGRLVSVLGMHNVIVVDTPDAVLVCPRERASTARSEEHTSELQSLRHLVCRLLLEKKKKKQIINEGD